MPAAASAAEPRPNHRLDIQLDLTLDPPLGCTLSVRLSARLAPKLAGRLNSRLDRHLGPGFSLPLPLRLGSWFNSRLKSRATGGITPRANWPQILSTAFPTLTS